MKNGNQIGEIHVLKHTQQHSSIYISEESSIES